MVWLLMALGALLLFGVLVGAVVFLAAKKGPKKPVAVDDFGDPVHEAPARAIPPPPVAEPAPAAAPPPPRAVPVEVPAPPRAEPAPPPTALAEAPRRPVLPEGAFASRPTLVADPDFEPSDEPAAPAPGWAEPAPAPAPVETPAAVPVPLDQIEKLRIADVDLVVRASGLRLGGVDLLAFTTEGFGARGRMELALYVDRAAVADADVVRSLKRFAGLALHAIERPAPITAGELLKLPGEVGGVPLAGYLAVEANEPAAVAMGDHVVLLGLAKADLAGDASAVRDALVARHGGLPWVTPLRREA